MKKAAIDIGSNTILLLVAEVSGSQINVLYEDQRTPRLGKEVDESGNLHPDSIKRAVSALRDYQKFLEEKYPDLAEVTITATSAVRDAANRNVFTTLVKQQTGFNITILSGEEEAKYTFFGAKNMLPEPRDKLAVVDIGGGSTEISVGTPLQVIDQYSFNMGSVRFTERYLRDEPASSDQILKCKAEVYRMLQEKDMTIGSDIELVGVAGTVTSLALMEIGLDEYVPNRITGNQITRVKLARWIQNITEHESSWLLGKYPVIMKDRADVFLGGLLILQQIMIYFDKEYLVVSTGGIRHGALLE